MEGLGGGRPVRLWASRVWAELPLRKYSCSIPEALRARRLLGDPREAVLGASGGPTLLLPAWQAPPGQPVPSLLCLGCVLSLRRPPRPQPSQLSFPGGQSLPGHRARSYSCGALIVPCLGVTIVLTVPGASDAPRAQSQAARARPSTGSLSRRPARCHSESHLHVCDPQQVLHEMGVAAPSWRPAHP